MYREDKQVRCIGMEKFDSASVITDEVVHLQTKLSKLLVNKIVICRDVSVRTSFVVLEAQCFIHKASPSLTSHTK